MQQGCSWRRWQSGCAVSAARAQQAPSAEAGPAAACTTCIRTAIGGSMLSSIASARAHLEHSRAVAQHICKQAVAAGPARQRRAQHAAVWQHQLGQQPKVVLPRLVRDIHGAARHGARHAVQHACVWRGGERGREVGGEAAMEQRWGL